MQTNQILKALINEPHEITWNPKGNSMTPKIHSGDRVKIKHLFSNNYKIGDIVYCKVKGNYYLHLITAFDEAKQRYQISNNHGHINGWTPVDKIYGICVEVDGILIISNDEIIKREL